MTETGLVELRFWALIALSLAVPVGLYALLRKRRAISTRTTLLLGVTLVTVAAVDTGLLHSLASGAAQTVTKLDDVFASEMAIGLYLVPALFGGVGIDLISTVLRNHLQVAEHRHRSGHKGGG
jgi:EamA domain-containing membrane protein RarD